MQRALAIATFSVIFAGSACSSKETSDNPKEAAGQDGKDGKEKAPRDKSNVKRVTTSVPMGKKIACADLLPDIAKFKELVAEDISEVADRSKQNKSASSSCAFVKGGEPLTSDAQIKKYKSENLKLGVLPGDVYCEVTIYCSLSTDEGDLKKKCEDDGKRETELGSRTLYEGSSSLGQFACVRKSDRPPEDYAYTFRTIDSDTQCMFEVMGGPSVVSEELVQNCTRAALDTIGPAHLKNYK